MSEPRGQRIGVVDEYGSIWDREPGAPGSQIIGDLVPHADEETSDVFLGCDRCATLASCKITGHECLHQGSIHEKQDPLAGQEPSAAPAITESESRTVSDSGQGRLGLAADRSSGVLAPIIPIERRIQLRSSIVGARPPFRESLLCVTTDELEIFLDRYEHGGFSSRFPVREQR